MALAGSEKTVSVQKERRASTSPRRNSYNSLLVQRRRGLHRTIGLVIEELYADRLAEQWEVLAYHFLRGEEWEKALHYLREAAAKAAARSAHPEAIAHLEQAVGVIEHLPESRQRAEQAIDLRLAMRNSLVPSGEFARIFEVLTDAEAIAHGLGDQRRLGRVFAYLAHHAWATVDYQRAIEFGRRALAVAIELGDLPLQVVANNVMAQTYHDLADYGSAIELFQRTVTVLSGDLIGERFGLPNLPSVASRSVLAWCLGWQGDFQGARAQVQEALRIAEAAEHPASMANAFQGAGLAYLLQGDLAAAVPALERSVAIYGSLHFKNAAVLSFLAYAHALAGRIDEALPLFERSLDLAAAIKFLPCNSIWIVWWGEACLLGNRPDEAGDRAVRALELAQTQKEPAYEAHALHLLGEIAARRDAADVTKGQNHYRQAIALAERLGMRPLIARCHLGLGRLHRRIGDRPGARRHLGLAAAMLREMDMRLWLAQAEMELAALAGGAGTDAAPPP